MNFIQTILILGVIAFIPRIPGQGLRFDLYPEYRWPNRMIPYFINSGDFSPWEIVNIQRAVTHINLNTCVKFIPWIFSQEDYVHIFRGHGCYSSIGRVGGRQTLSLGSGCTNNLGTIIHELEHVLGFDHEHNRLDRDDYIEILWDNIPEVWKSQYQKSDPRYFGLQRNYDYYSIMHYFIDVPGTQGAGVLDTVLPFQDHLKRPYINETDQNNRFGSEATHFKSNTSIAYTFPVSASGTNALDAFRIKQNGIDPKRVGTGNALTRTDIDKINSLYC